MAHEFYVKITGAQQGDFPGDAAKTRHADKIAGISYSHMIDAPRDARRGSESGARNHYPITFTKEWGAASPLLMQAMCTNEVLTVTIEFERTVDAVSTTYFKITLDQCLISQIKYTTGGIDSSGSTVTQSSYDTMELEHVSLVYQTITMEEVLAGTAATDNWAEV